jgi:hypothetical protein
MRRIKADFQVVPAGQGGWAVSRTHGSGRGRFVLVPRPSLGDRLPHAGACGAGDAAHGGGRVVTSLTRDQISEAIEAIHDISIGDRFGIAYGCMKGALAGLEVPTGYPVLDAAIAFVREYDLVAEEWR